MDPSDIERLRTTLRENPHFVFFGWLSLGVISWLFFHFVRSARLKRILFPLFTFATGALFLGLIAFVFGIRREMAYVAVPAVIIIGFLNILSTRFCNHCGRTLTRQPIFRKARFCSHCGEPLS